MSAEQNATLVRRYFDECVVGASGPEPARALAVVDELLTDDFVMFYNSDTDEEATRGRERHKEFLVAHVQAYPDDHWAIEALIAGDEVVACQWRMQATSARTRNPIDVRAADFFQIRDGRLSELRRFLDFRSLNRQARRPASQA